MRIEDILRIKLESYSLEWNESREGIDRDRVDMKVQNYLNEMLGNHTEKFSHWKLYDNGKNKTYDERH